MKRVTIVGTGLGANTLTPEALEAIEQADVLLGAPRMLEMYGGANKATYPYYLPKDVAAAIDGDDARTFAVPVSGDVGFYSAAAGLCDVLSAHELRFIPGISTVAVLFARLKLSWQDATFVSAHGREANLADAVRRNRLTFCLSGNNVNALGEALCGAGFAHVKTYVGENLGMVDERVYETDAEGLKQGSFPSLTVLLFVNDSFDDSVPAGLPDGRFERIADIPMTKSETRALVLSKLGIHPTDVCWDVGAGTGSVTVEMALNAYRGHAYAVERKEEAIPLIEKNRTSFHIGNITVIHGEAPAALEPLPAPDVVFIGGSGGEMPEIVESILCKNPKVRIVVTAVTLETVSLALSAFTKAGIDPEIVQINVARGKKAGKSHLMEAQNPITILSAGGKA